MAILCSGFGIVLLRGLVLSALTFSLVLVDTLIQSTCLHVEFDLRMHESMWYTGRFKPANHDRRRDGVQLWDVFKPHCRVVNFCHWCYVVIYSALLEACDLGSVILQAHHQSCWGLLGFRLQACPCDEFLSFIEQFECISLLCDPAHTQKTGLILLWHWEMPAASNAADRFDNLMFLHSLQVQVSAESCFVFYKAD